MSGNTTTGYDGVLFARRDVTGNTAGIDGGGIFTVAPVTLTQSLVIGNAPDNCVGC